MIRQQEEFLGALKEEMEAQARAEERKRHRCGRRPYEDSSRLRGHGPPYG